MNNDINIINTYTKYIKPLFDHIKLLLHQTQNEVFIRKSKLSFADIFYFICSVNATTSSSYVGVLSKIKVLKLLDYNVTDSAITKRKNNIPSTVFEKINDNIINKMYEIINSDTVDDIVDNTVVKYRLLSCDGSIFYARKSFEKDGVILSNNKHCCLCLLSSIYDIEKKIPISQVFNKKNDETEALKSQIYKFKQTDIIVMDRLYYSISLFHYFVSNNVNAVFRLRSNTNIFKKINNSKESDITTTVKYNNIEIPIRLIKYKIRTPCGTYISYKLGTTLLDKKKFTQEYFKDAYFKRWNIEVYFKKLKEYTPIRHTKSKTLESVIKDIHISQFLFIISSYIKYVLEQKIKKKEDDDINSKECFTLVSDDLLKNIFFTKQEDNTLNILTVISKNLVKNIKNRHNERIKKSPVDKKCTITGTEQMRFTKHKKTQKKIEKSNLFKSAFNFEQIIINTK